MISQDLRDSEPQSPGDERCDEVQRLSCGLTTDQAGIKVPRVYIMSEHNR